MLSIIAAVASNNTIGNNNKLPWHFKEDFDFFKKMTMNNVVIMGSNTFESIGNKPLSNRINIIVSRKTTFNVRDDCYYSTNLENAIELGKAFNRQIFIIGGEQVYKASLPLVDTLYITHIKADYKGDTFFPVLNKAEWSLEVLEEHENFYMTKWSRL